MTKSLLRAADIMLLTLLVLPILAPLTVEASLASTPWPMFHHDLQHTGQSQYVGSQAPTLKWKFTTGNIVDSSAAIGSDGTIYVGSDDHNLYALNPNGTQRWKFATGAAISISSPAIGTDGTIYFGSQDSNVYALNANGTQKWRFATGNIIPPSPAIGSDGTVYIASWDHNVYALNPDGTQKWRFTTGGLVTSSPAIGSDGTIYVGTDDHYVYALNANGTQKWRFATGNIIDASPAIGSDDTIYVGTHGGKLYAISSNGTQRWKFAAGGGVSSASIGSDGTIYFGSGDHNYYALNPNGKQKWAFATGASVAYSSPAIGSDGTIYAASTDHNLYAINPDGTQKWKFATGDLIVSSPAIGSDGTVYIGSRDDNLYAIGGSPLMLQPLQGPVGQNVTVSGTKFVPSSSITVKFDSKTVATTVSDVNGSFTTTFKVPKSTAGSHSVTARDSSGNPGGATFTVIPSTKLTPKSGAAGTSVTFTGKGFAANSVVTLKFGGTMVTTATTDGMGSFTATFLVPSVTPGSYHVKATDSGGNSDKARFTVL